MLPERASHLTARMLPERARMLPERASRLTARVLPERVRPPSAKFSCIFVRDMVYF